MDMNGYLTRQRLMLPFRIIMRGAQILRENQEVAKLPPDASYERKIEILAEAGRRGMSGNCSEMAAIAFLFLRDRGVRPLVLHVLQRQGPRLRDPRPAGE